MINILKKKEFYFDITLFLLFFIAIGIAWDEYLNQHRYDEPIKKIVAYYKEKKVNTIALPQTMRSYVSFFLNSNIVPVLYNIETVSPQFLTFFDIDSILYLKDRPYNDIRINSLIFYQQSFKQIQIAFIEKNSPQVPLLKGQNINHEISRPYVYSPLKDSLELSYNDTYERTFLLDDGNYYFCTEVFSIKNNKNQYITISIIVGDKIIKKQNFRVKRLVYEPVKRSFSLKNTILENKKNITNVKVKISLLSKSKEKFKAFFHRFELGKTF